MNISNISQSSLWSLIPFTKANKEARYVLDKHRLSQEYEQEQQRIQQLDNFLNQCHEGNPKSYDILLKELLYDSLLTGVSHSSTKSSSSSSSFLDSTEKQEINGKSVSSKDYFAALRHFQRLKYLEEQQQQQQQHDEVIAVTVEMPIKNQQQEEEEEIERKHKKFNTHVPPLDIIVPIPLMSSLNQQQVYDHSSSICTWIGHSEKGQSLHCINKCILHPWKKYKSLSTGVFLPLSTGFCIFHQKYCLDTQYQHYVNKRDAICSNTTDEKNNFGDYSSIHPISLPNRLGLCKECFVLDQGFAPPCMMMHTKKNNNNDNVTTKQTFLFCHVPGVQRKVYVETKAIIQ